MTQNARQDLRQRYGRNTSANRACWPGGWSSRACAW